ncbi:MAG TPA: aspartate aminotransferase family protein [Myxococcales bacterium]|jgi:putrescine aminotransferase
MDELIARLLSDARGRAFELHRSFVNPGFVDLLQLAGYGRTFVRASGVELFDESGASYLDFCSGYGVLNLGYNPPAVKAALREVLEADLPGFAQVDCPTLEGLAAQALCRTLPSGLDRVFFCCTGTEAVEAALKLARASTRRSRLIGCEGAYHGLTLGSLALNGNAAMRAPFEPLTPGAARIPFDDERALERELSRRDVAAFVVEPIQGEGGCVVPRAGYLRAARELCDRYGTLLVVDEVQTGLGRTGSLFSFEREAIVPDAVCLAKALSGGLVPVGAMVARGTVHARAYGTTATQGLHGTTFGGGPMAMAAVLATLKVVQEEQLAQAAADLGRHLKDRLQELARRHPIIREVRGHGLMLALEFQDASRGWLEKTPLSRLSGATAALFVQHVALQLMNEHRIVAQSAVNAPAVLKVMPPLIVRREQCDRFVDALDKVLEGAGHGSAIAKLALEALKVKAGR